MLGLTSAPFKIEGVAYERLSALGDAGSQQSKLVLGEHGDCLERDSEIPHRPQK